MHDPFLLFLLILLFLNAFLRALRVSVVKTRSAPSRWLWAGQELPGGRAEL
jgi:hypothetical protein